MQDSTVVSKEVPCSCRLDCGHRELTGFIGIKAVHEINIIISSNDVIEALAVSNNASELNLATNNQ